MGIIESLVEVLMGFLIGSGCTILGLYIWRGRGCARKAPPREDSVPSAGEEIADGFIPVLYPR